MEKNRKQITFSIDTILKGNRFNVNTEIVRINYVEIA